MKTQKQRLAAFMFAALVCVMAVLPVLANSPAMKIICFVGMITGMPDDTLGPLAAIGAVLGFTPAWPAAAVIL